MALYTIILTFRRGHYAFQVEERSVMGALRKWARDLDYSTLRDFGELSKCRLIDALDKSGPNVVKGLANVSSWGAGLGGYVTKVWIIETEPEWSVGQAELQKSD